MILIAISCMVLYVVLAVAIGGYIHALKEGEGLWDLTDAIIAGIFWPITLLWYGLLYPITKMGMRLARWQVAYSRMREKAQYEHRVRLAEGERIVNEFLSQEDQRMGVSSSTR